jgi:hypothetical protein
MLINGATLRQWQIPQRRQHRRQGMDGTPKQNRTRTNNQKPCQLSGKRNLLRAPPGPIQVPAETLLSNHLRKRSHVAVTNASGVHKCDQLTENLSRWPIIAFQDPPPGSCRCNCMSIDWNDAESAKQKVCEHVFDGWREFDHSGTAVCVRCGMEAMHHDLICGP